MVAYFCGMNKAIVLFYIILITLFSCKNNDAYKKAAQQKITATYIKNLSEQVQKNGDSIGLRFNYIAALDSIGDFKNAIAQMDSLILKDRGNYALWFKMGKIYEHSKDTSEAITCYQNALKIYRAPDGILALINLYAETKNALALTLCNEIDNFRMGREYDSYTSFFRGIYYARMGNKQQATLALDKSIISNYSFIDAYMEKGFILYDDKKYAEALKVFATAATINVTFADAHYWKGKCYEAMNNKQGATTQYQRALALDKDLKEADERLRLLSNSGK